MNRWLGILFLAGLFAVSGCGDGSSYTDHQPVTLTPVDLPPGVVIEPFVPEDIVAVRPTIYPATGNTAAQYEIDIAFTGPAVERALQLPEGVEFVCSTPRGVLGRSRVEKFIGMGKGGYCLAVKYPDRQSFEAARKYLK